MKNRNRWIIALLAVGILLFAVMQLYVIPLRQARQNQYLAAQQEPATHDLNTILSYKSRYMGDASNDANLFQSLPLSNVGMSFQVFPEKLMLEVNYKDTVWNIGKEKAESALLYNSTAAFALIDNLQEIDYEFDGATYRVKRTSITTLYSDFHEILQTGHWRTAVQAKMNDEQYIGEAFQKSFQS